MGDDQRTIDQRDVFISYGHADAEWVRTLAENLSQSGLALFFDEWDIAPGDVLVHKLDEGIASVPNGWFRRQRSGRCGSTLNMRR